MRNDLIELLAPAGSYEGMKAAIHAGADAVYIGGHLFGARAYAKNLAQDDRTEAIRYAHIHGRKLYLTVNTLMKEQELEGQLYEFLAPFYQAGLDAVIVQDLGTLQYIREEFPGLPIHASTQMTLTGEMGARMLEELGASRIVTARELSLKEIKKIREDCELEIESFIHGALCYCYSGQCLFSSLAGGRSGNRGRCAQPCRLEYQVREGKKRLTREGEGFLLSPKDLNALTLLPDIIEAGVTSLKIEGRMKKPEYTAGVVSIYRKYLDAYLLSGREGYRVEEQDEKNLLALFNRKGFTEGYYNQHNGKNMITLNRPDFRGGAEEYNKQIREAYLVTELKEKIKGKLIISQDLPAKINLTMRDISVEVEKYVPVKAEKKPLTVEMVEKQMKKTGNTPFVFGSLEICLEDGLFLPVVQLNELRRLGLKKLEQEICKKKERPLKETRDLKSEASEQEIEEEAGSEKYELQLTASVETWEQLEAALQEPAIDRVYVDSLLTKKPQELIKKVHHAGKECYEMLPVVFRAEAKKQFSSPEDSLAGFDGCLVRSMEELGWIKKYGWSGKFIIDHNLYSYNHRARRVWKELGACQDTVPVELNAREMIQRGTYGSELIAYGRLPMMVSAQCLKKTTKGCDNVSDRLELVDRLGNVFPVKNYCPYCYNTIYNSKPLSLLDVADSVKKSGLQSVRLSFTVEGEDETKRVCKMFGDALKREKNNYENIGDFTRGHYKRGVE